LGYASVTKQKLTSGGKKSLYLIEKINTNKISCTNNVCRNYVQWRSLIKTTHAIIVFVVVIKKWSIMAIMVSGTPYRCHTICSDKQNSDRSQSQLHVCQVIYNLQAINNKLTEL